MNLDRLSHLTESMLKADRQVLRTEFWDLEIHADSTPIEESMAIILAYSYKSCDAPERKEISDQLLKFLSALKHDRVSHGLASIACFCHRLRGSKPGTAILEGLTNQITFELVENSKLIEAIGRLPQEIQNWLSVLKIMEAVIQTGRLDLFEFVADRLAAKIDGVKPLQTRVRFLRGDPSALSDRSFVDDHFLQLSYAITVQDYRSLIGQRSSSHNLMRLVEIWMINQLSATPRHSGRSVRDPRSLRFNSADPGSELASIAKLIASSLAEKNSSQLISESFAEQVDSLAAPEHRLMAWFLVAKSGQNSGNTLAQSIGNDRYAQLSLALSRNSSSDILRLAERPLGKSLKHIQQMQVSRLSRGVTASKSAMRFGANILNAKIRSLAAPKADRRKRFRALLMDALKSMFQDISAMRGAVQKIAQLGMSIESSLPYELRDSLRTILDDGISLTPKQVTEILKQEIGPELNRYLQDFDDQPFASGSVGQVHHATSLDGTKLCIKIKYPGIESAVKADFRNLKMISGLIEPFLPRQNLKEIISQWERYATAECDFVQELKYHQSCGEILASAGVRTPKIIPELCTSKILTTEFVDGVELMEFAANADQLTKNQIAVELWRSLYILLEAGYFRSDIHPGNYLVAEGRLVYLDFGAILSGDPLRGFNHIEFMTAIMNDDREGLARLFVECKYTTEAEAMDAATQSLSFLGKPFRGRFKFTESYARDVFRGMTEKIGPQVRIPNEHIDLVRVFWGLYSILAALGAEADWHRELEAFKIAA